MGVSLEMLALEPLADRSEPLGIERRLSRAGSSGATDDQVASIPRPGRRPLGLRRARQESDRRVTDRRTRPNDKSAAGLPDWDARTGAKNESFTKRRGALGQRKELLTSFCCGIYSVTVTSYESNVRRIREERGMTQEQLASAVGVSRQTISSIEKGLSEPKVLLAIGIGLVLGVEIAELFRRALLALVVTTR